MIDDSLRRDLRWVSLLGLVAGSVLYVFGFALDCVALPNGHAARDADTPLLWDLAAWPGLFILILALSTTILMVFGRKRDLVPRRSTLGITVLASVALICALIGTAQLLNMKTIRVEVGYEHYRDSMPFTLTAAPLVVTIGLAFIAFCGWRLWCVAQAKYLRDLRELARVDREIAADAGDILPEVPEPDIRL